MDKVELLMRVASFQTDETLVDLRVPDTLLRDLCVTAAREGLAGWLCRRVADSYSHSQWLSLAAYKLRPAALATAAANARNTVLLSEVENLCAAKGIRMVALKGVAMQIGYYADQSLRPIGDMDLYVEPSRVYEARDILVAEGAVNSNPDQPPVVGMLHAHLPVLNFRSQKIELHHHLFLPEDELEPAEGILELCRERNGHLMLPPADMFYHLAVHVYHHMSSTGYWRVGWLVDLAVILEAATDPVALVITALEANANGNEAVRWALECTLPLLSAKKAALFESVGFMARRVGDVDKDQETTTLWGFKMHAVAEKLRNARLRLASKKGFAAKWNELCALTAYEHKRTMEAYPGSWAVGAWLKRIFGIGLSGARVIHKKK